MAARGQAPDPAAAGGDFNRQVPARPRISRRRYARSALDGSGLIASRAQRKTKRRQSQKAKGKDQTPPQKPPIKNTTKHKKGPTTRQTPKSGETRLTPGAGRAGTAGPWIRVGGAAGTGTGSTSRPSPPPPDFGRTGSPSSDVISRESDSFDRIYETPYASFTGGTA